MFLLIALNAFADGTAPAVEPAPVETTEYTPIRGSCPSYAPIKGNVTPSSREYCIFHTPGGLYYLRTDAERCFTSEDAAITAGCRKSHR